MKDNTTRLQKKIREAGLDALIISAPENVYYISDVPTSFTNSNRLLFCSRRANPIMCIVPREGEPSLILSAAALDVTKKHTWIKDLKLYATGTYILRREKVDLEGMTFLETITKVLKEKLEDNGRPKRIGIEYNDLSFVNYDGIKKSLQGVEFSNGLDLLMETRMIKNAEEIRRFEKANQILCRVLKKIEKACKDRPTELELDTILKSEMLKEGAESWQQTTIAAGPIGGPDIYNQPNPKRKLRHGDLIRLDIGCIYKGYTADVSRTFAVEKVNPRAAKVYKVLKEAFMLYLDKLEPGTRSSEINSGVVSYVRETLDKQYYRGNVGHGTGVELYDRPILGPDDHTPLQEGMTISYEVPYHISGLGGLNLEDSVVITGNGKKVVSKYDRDIVVV
ncbi:MAG TPA: Xaa-Pro peptidase family protein [Nitrososphaerales archaeon]|nr:Xaa-Pro peptidase family protein [Nitrososphaerales archaeon]